MHPPRRWPDSSARRTCTYAELLDESEAVARALLALAGIVLVTVNPALRRDEVKYVLEQSKARGVFAVDAFRDQSPTKVASDLQADLPGLEHVISIVPAEIEKGLLRPVR